MILQLLFCALLLGSGIIVIVACASGRSGRDAFVAAAAGATIIMSVQMIYVYVTGKLPTGLVSLAKDVNENRAK